MEQLYDAYYRELLVGYVASHIAAKRKNEVVQQTGKAVNGKQSSGNQQHVNVDLLRDVALLRDFALTACGRPPDSALSANSAQQANWKSAGAKQQQPTAAAASNNSNQKSAPNVNPAFPFKAPHLQESLSGDSPSLEWPMDFFGDDFTRSLAPLGNGLITVADTLLANNGEAFLGLLEQLGMQGKHFDVDFADFDGHSGDGGGGGSSSRGRKKRHNLSDDEDDEDDEEDSEYDSLDEVDEDEDDLDEEDEDDDDEDDDDNDSTTSVERFEESRRMFQVFVGKIFEDRLIHAYKEKVALENHERLLRELEEEEDHKKEQEQRKKEKKKSKKEKKKQQQQQLEQVKEQEEEEDVKEQEEQVNEEEEEEEEVDELMAELDLQSPKDPAAFYESSLAAVKAIASESKVTPDSSVKEEVTPVNNNNTSKSAAKKKKKKKAAEEKQQVGVNPSPALSSSVSPVPPQPPVAVVKPVASVKPSLRPIAEVTPSLNTSPPQVQQPQRTGSSSSVPAPQKPTTSSNVVKTAPKPSVPTPITPNYASIKQSLPVPPPGLGFNIPTIQAPVVHPVQSAQAFPVAQAVPSHVTHAQSANINQYESRPSLTAALGNNDDPIVKPVQSRQRYAPIGSRTSLLSAAFSQSASLFSQQPVSAMPTLPSAAAIPAAPAPFHSYSNNQRLFTQPPQPTGAPHLFNMNTGNMNTSHEYVSPPPPQHMPSGHYNNMLYRQGGGVMPTGNDVFINNSYQQQQQQQQQMNSFPQQQFYQNILNPQQPHQQQYFK